MIKKVFILLLLVLLSCYFVVAITVLNRPQEGVLCSDVEAFIGDSAQIGFIKKDEIINILTQNQCNPVGKNLDEISLVKIEKTLLNNPYISDVTAYKTPNGKVNVIVKQYIPTVYVMAEGGQNYFLDRSGRVLPHLSYFADLVVATGHITPQFAKQSLAPLGCLLQDDAFWSNQVQQINITENGEVELVPRVGNHIIALGPPTNLEEKLTRMKEFYTEGLKKVGWNKYSRISLKYDNQIVCKKR
ncbi:MAG: hypothetical protein IJZ01_01490 [Paraprevotella sp.]|nr:hypothetical protein [Paraprevotella sp.]